MGFFDDIAKAAADEVLGFIPGGNVVKAIAKNLFGTDSEADAEALVTADPVKQLELDKAVLEHKVKTAVVNLEVLREKNRHAEAENQDLRQKINEHEGTANDLKQFGFLGRVILFLRGCQRPIWGFFALVLTWHVVTGIMSAELKLPESERLSYMLLLILMLIDLLVLSFLFGERALKNLLPFALQLLGIKIDKTVLKEEDNFINTKRY